MTDIRADTRYQAIKKQAIRGWHEWNVRSVLSYVHFPDGLSLNIAVKEYQNGGYLKETLIGRLGKHEEQVVPGLNCAWYSALELSWRSLRLRVEKAVVNEDLLLLVTPIAGQLFPAMLVLEAGMLWNRPGHITRSGNALQAVACGGVTDVTALGNAASDPNIPAQNAYIALRLDGCCAFITGRARSMDDVIQSVADARNRAQAVYSRDEAGRMSEAIACAIAWDTIYDPAGERLITPVSRIWSVGAGGYVLFCWDTYFVGALASTFSKEIAYANLWEITATATRDGFIPNLTYATGQQSLDRSQPPVGSAMALYVYRVFSDRWLLEALYPALKRWNAWFFENRSQASGALSWGSNPYTPVYGNTWETDGVNARFGAALESGLDNSPMYDDIPFDQATHMLCLEDVGLTGLFIWDCDALSQIADILGQHKDKAVFQSRKERAQDGLAALWDDERGFFYNRRTDTGAFSRCISPTNFYALFSDRVTRAQVEKITGHYFNPDEFYGEWMLPSVARNHPAYPQQDYWRGRIWAPMNFLCYLAAVERGANRIRGDIAQKSAKLFLKEWNSRRHVHENYNGDTGEGCDVANSDRFYHWGALLALIWQMEAGACLAWEPMGSKR